MQKGRDYMRKFWKKCVLFVVIMLICTMFTACSSSARINYDLTTSDTYATSTIQNIERDPYKYNGKTIKVWGKLKGSSSYYTLNENATCCNWSFELRMGDMSVPKSGTNITITGKCVVEKINGRTSWDVNVSEIN